MKKNLLLIPIMLLTFTSQHIACNKKSKAPQNVKNNDSDAAKTKAAADQAARNAAAQAARDAAAQAAKDKIATRAANKLRVDVFAPPTSTTFVEYDQKKDSKIDFASLKDSPELNWVRSNNNTRQWLITMERDISISPWDKIWGAKYDQEIKWMVLIDDFDFNIRHLDQNQTDDPSRGIQIIQAYIPPIKPEKNLDMYTIRIFGLCKNTDPSINFQREDFLVTGAMMNLGKFRIKMKEMEKIKILTDHSAINTRVK